MAPRGYHAVSRRAFQEIGPGQVGDVASTRAKTNVISSPDLCDATVLDDVELIGEEERLRWVVSDEETGSREGSEMVDQGVT